MFQATHAREDASRVADALGGETVGGLVSLALGAAAGDDEPRENGSANKGRTMIDGLDVAFLGVKGEIELLAQKALNHVDIAQQLISAFERNENIKIIDIATIMGIAQLVDNVTVELVKENIGKQLAGEIANHNALTFWLAEKTLVTGQLAPIGAASANSDVAHGLIIDNFLPDIAEQTIKGLTILGEAANVVLEVGTIRMEKLLLKAPKHAAIEEIVLQAHEIALDIEFSNHGGAGVILGHLAEMVGEPLLAIKRALTLATGVGVRDKTPVPPVGADIKEEMMDDAVAKRSGHDLANDRIMDDEGDAAAGVITVAQHTFAEIENVFHVVEFETVLVDGETLAFAGGKISAPKFVAEKIAKGI